MLFKRGFCNLNHVKTTKSLKDVLKCLYHRAHKEKNLAFVMPVEANPRISFLQQNSTLPTVTWIGHSTFLIQLAGMNIITDPIWSNRLGLERRLSPPGLRQTDLPQIDAVLISHNHYDHLSFSTLRTLKGDPLFLVPSGLREVFLKKKFSNVEELTWWETKKVCSLECTFLPAQHWSRRSVFDKNKTLWGSWALREAENNANTGIYFAGDSGYFPCFKEIGKKYDITYALMPIGCYEPEWFTHLQHMSPADAVKAYRDLNAKYFIPMHYGAFRLADDTPEEALDYLLDQWHSKDLEPSNLIILKLGETLTL